MFIKPRLTLSILPDPAYNSGVILREKKLPVQTFGQSKVLEVQIKSNS